MKFVIPWLNNLNVDIQIVLVIRNNIEYMDTIKQWITISRARGKMHLKATFLLLTRT